MGVDLNNVWGTLAIRKFANGLLEICVPLYPSIHFIERLGLHFKGNTTGRVQNSDIGTEWQRSILKSESEPNTFWWVKGDTVIAKDVLRGIGLSDQRQRRAMGSGKGSGTLGGDGWYFCA